MSKQEDRAELRQIADNVNNWLWLEKVPPTLQNIIQALCEQRYLDWTGWDIVPMCEPQSWGDLYYVFGD